MLKLLKFGSRLKTLDGREVRIKRVGCPTDRSDYFGGHFTDPESRGQYGWAANGAYDYYGKGFNDGDLDPLSILSDEEADRLNKIDDLKAAETHYKPKMGISEILALFSESCRFMGGQ